MPFHTHTGQLKVGDGGYYAYFAMFLTLGYNYNAVFFAPFFHEQIFGITAGGKDRYLQMGMVCCRGVTSSLLVTRTD